MPLILIVDEPTAGLDLEECIRFRNLLRDFADISELTLGNVGLFVAVLSDSVIAGYLVSIGYFLFNYLGNISDTNIFFLFSMGTGDFTTKVWLLGISILLITITLTYVMKKKVC